MNLKSRVQVGDIFRSVNPLTDGNTTFFKIISRDNLEGGSGMWENGRIAKWSESAMLDTSIWLLVKRSNHTLCGICNPTKSGPKFGLGYRNG